MWVSFFVYIHIYIKIFLKYIIMKKSELKKLVEQKVNEAWYNNLDDFYHGVGKCATIGALGAATLGGCAYAADKGAENNYQYNQQVNQQAADNYKYTEEAYQKWCQDHKLNPDDQFTLDQYNEWISDDGINESQLNDIIHSAIKTVMNETRERNGGFSKDGHKKYAQRMNNIENIVRSTMRDVAKLVDERMQECASSLYQEGIADAEQIIYQWEREIRNAIFSQTLQDKFIKSV